MGNVKIVYNDDVWLSGLFFAFLAFNLATILLWQINIRYFLRPANPNFIGSMPDFINSDPITHIKYWWTLVINKLPFHLFQQSADTYRAMGYWMDQNGLLYTIIVRWLIAVFCSAIGGWWGAMLVIKNPVPGKIEKSVRGSKIFTGAEAVTQWAKQQKDELEDFGSFVEITKGVHWSYSKFATHCIGIGASGSGKSQFLNPIVKSALKLSEDENIKFKAVLLDPKYEFTQAYYDPSNPHHAILDPTDERSHVWDFERDINTISKMRRFANSFIPAGEGDQAMWSNAARLLFIGCQVFLAKNFKDYTAKDLSELFGQLTLKELHFIMKNYYPPALDAVGQADEAGNVEDSTTAFGVRLNLKGYIDGLIDLGRYWYKPEQKKISLFEFMTNPDYEIRVLFIKPNDDERLLSSGVIRSALNFMISLLDTPAITDTRQPRGVFIMDEFQAPGKLTDEEGKPTINKLLDRGRSKGWGSFLFVQELLQLYNTYSENEVEQWRMVASTFVLTGTPPGKTAQMTSDMVGKEYFDKQHGEPEWDPNTKTWKRPQVQEHERPVILPTEIASYLKPVKRIMKDEFDEKGNPIKRKFVRSLVLTRGLDGGFVFEIPIEPLPKNQDAFIQQIENVELINPDSRSINLVKEQMKEQQKKSQENMKSVDELPQANLLGVKGLQWSDRPNPEKQVSEDTQVDYIPDDGELSMPAPEPINLEDDDAEEMVLLKYDINELLSLATALEYKLESQESIELESLIVGTNHNLSFNLFNKIMSLCGSSATYEPLIEFINSVVTTK
ncbi:type IV secretion system DNA-binding domain-containing protein [Ralstonia mannitolilytica]|uniref:type IV secretion system DNA-binding domain-containing protein n=1 Tax=Ralstonia mannitolilytica TaxID=105219 RepID=UPI001C984F5A|nr:type IV secretion system DNA-binding domain-containing protein [Ralstonia mannitolilytica]MBY4717585.1 type IV secretion system DNA-binding domain-containing protein [Ralstonia mannitolilytica]